MVVLLVFAGRSRHKHVEYGLGGISAGKEVLVQPSDADDVCGLDLVGEVVGEIERRKGEVLVIACPGGVEEAVEAKEERQRTGEGGLLSANRRDNYSEIMITLYCSVLDPASASAAARAASVASRSFADWMSSCSCRVSQRFVSGRS